MFSHSRRSYSSRYSPSAGSVTIGKQHRRTGTGLSGRAVHGLKTVFVMAGDFGDEFVSDVGWRSGRLFDP